MCRAGAGLRSQTARRYSLGYLTDLVPKRVTTSSRVRRPRLDPSTEALLGGSGPGIVRYWTRNDGPSWCRNRRYEPAERFDRDGARPESNPPRPMDPSLPFPQFVEVRITLHRRFCCGSGKQSRWRRESVTCESRLHYWAVGGRHDGRKKHRPLVRLEYDRTRERRIGPRPCCHRSFFERRVQRNQEPGQVPVGRPHPPVQPFIGEIGTAAVPPSPAEAHPPGTPVQPVNR